MYDIVHGIMETSPRKSVETGGFRENPVEPAWVYPPGYEYEVIRNNLFKMEYLKLEGVVIGRVVLQLHGGGYTGLMRNIYRRFTMRYSRLSFGEDVLAIDRRVAPEDPYPAALEDAAHACRWLVKEKHYRSGQIVMAGDSVGGGPALALYLYLRDGGLPQSTDLVLMSPWAGITCSGDSYEFNLQKDPLFGNARESMLYNFSYVGDAGSKDPYLSSIFGDFRGLPAMLLQTGSFEILLNDTLSVTEKAKEAGACHRVSVCEGMSHVFQMSTNLMPESREAWDEVARSVQIVFRIDRRPGGRVVGRVKGINKTENEK